MSEEDAPDERNRFKRFGDQLSGLLDPEAALRRGQGLVSGVTSTTKNEITRIVGAEVRNFLDKMDIADLAQQIIAGLQVDVSMTVKFSRDDEGRAQPEVTHSEANVSTAVDEEEPPGVLDEHVDESGDAGEGTSSSD
ncbi:MAG: hypothetical protein AAGA54_15200 [Myxococcota bacterium]